MRQIIQRIARGVLPISVRARTIPLGLARGEVANIDFKFDTAFYFGLHEPVLHRHYRRLVEPGMRCFDVGAFRGWDALALAKLTGAEVVSFDGIRECMEWSREFLAPSGRPIKGVHRFVGNGERDTLTLDEAAESHFVPDFIKIDVEGNEAAVLRGAEQLLSRRPSLIVETHGPEVEAECEQILGGHGYKPLIVDRPRGPFTEARSKEHNRWLVCDGVRLRADEHAD